MIWQWPLSSSVNFIWNYLDKDNWLIGLYKTLYQSTDHLCLTDKAEWPSGNEILPKIDTHFRNYQLYLQYDTASPCTLQLYTTKMGKNMSVAFLSVNHREHISLCADLTKLDVNAAEPPVCHTYAEPQSGVCCSV